ncbi:MAG: hypothetical protein ACJAYR_000804 [Sneathiella sp.]|jgi:hypothetical protein
MSPVFSGQKNVISGADMSFIDTDFDIRHVCPQNRGELIGLKRWQNACFRPLNWMNLIDAKSQNIPC